MAQDARLQQPDKTFRTQRVSCNAYEATETPETPISFPFPTAVPCGDLFQSHFVKRSIRIAFLFLRKAFTEQGEEVILVRDGLDCKKSTSTVKTFQIWTTFNRSKALNLKNSRLFSPIKPPPEILTFFIFNTKLYPFLVTATFLKMSKSSMDERGLGNSNETRYQDIPTRSETETPLGTRVGELQGLALIGMGYSKSGGHRKMGS